MQIMSHQSDCAIYNAPAYERKMCNCGTENPMQTVMQKALHYVELYELHFPHSGAADVAISLCLSIDKEQRKS